jgi:hypothetical protein
MGRSRGTRVGREGDIYSFTNMLAVLAPALFFDCC